MAVITNKRKESNLSRTFAPPPKVVQELRNKKKTIKQTGNNKRKYHSVDDRKTQHLEKNVDFWLHAKAAVT